jgi:hypothetical protein
MILSHLLKKFRKGIEEWRVALWLGWNHFIELLYCGLLLLFVWIGYYSHLVIHLKVLGWLKISNSIGWILGYKDQSKVSVLGIDWGFEQTCLTVFINMTCLQTYVHEHWVCL